MKDYWVVFRTIVEGTHKGVITRTAFESKQAFDKWYDAKMKSWYEVVAEGVTEAKSEEFCRSDEAQIAVLLSGLREIGQLLCQI